MLRLTCASVLAVVLLASAGQVPAQTQQTTGPVATYWMTARTGSGFPTAGSGGFNPMAMLSGGGTTKSLTLQLQSGRTAASPEAEHQPPAGLDTGPLPLVTPRQQPDAEPRPFGDLPDRDGEVRMRIYHGCGRATGPGQPLVLEISTANPTRSASQMSALMESIRLSPEAAPSPGTGRTYGDWPNGRSDQSVPANGSLVGDHRVRGNYTPDISFRLGEDQDFMGPVRLTGVSGGGPLGWNDVEGARGYFASTMGADEAGDLVLWTSSDVAVAFGQVPDILAPADLERLIRQGVVLPASTNQCEIPQAVQAAAPESMLSVVAFGGEANFSHPPRPANPREVWNIEHVVKVRYASTTSTILGMDMDMGEFARDDEGTRDEAEPGPRDALRNPSRAIRGILGGIIRQP